MLRSGCHDASFIPSDGVHLFERWRPSMDQGSTHRNKWFPPKPGRMDDDIALINSQFGLTFRSCYFRKTARPFWYFGDGMLRWAEQMGIQKFCSLVTEIFQKPRKKTWDVGWCPLFTIKSGESSCPRCFLVTKSQKLQHFSSHFGPKNNPQQLTTSKLPGDETLDLLFIHGTWGACLRHVNTFWKLRMRADGWEVSSHNWWHWKIYLKMTIKNDNNH